MGGENTNPGLSRHELNPESLRRINLIFWKFFLHKIHYATLEQTRLSTSFLFQLVYHHVVYMYYHIPKERAKDAKFKL